MKEEYKIEVETTGDYKTKKQFIKIVEMTDKQFLALSGLIVDFTTNPAPTAE